MELMGHSPNNYTRYSVSVLTSSDGSVNLPTSRSYDTYAAASRAWDVGRFGLERIGGFSYVGRAPTRYLTQPSASTPVSIAGSGYGSKGFTRTGIFTMLAVKKVDITPLFTHATESAYVALGIPSSDALAPNVHSPQWNGRMLEVNYTPTLQFIATARYEDIRNTRQTFAQSAGNYGDLDAETVSFRWYPFMTSRDGLALHTEYSKVHSMGISAIGGNQTNRSGFIGVDFAY